MSTAQASERLQTKFLGWVKARDPDRYGLYRQLLNGLPNSDGFWRNIAARAEMLDEQRFQVVHYLFMAAGRGRRNHPVRRSFRL
jgi:hypothetical protein